MSWIKLELKDLTIYSRASRESTVMREAVSHWEKSQAHNPHSNFTAQANFFGVLKVSILDMKIIDLEKVPKNILVLNAIPTKWLDKRPIWFCTLNIYCTKTWVPSSPFSYEIWAWMPAVSAKFLPRFLCSALVTTMVAMNHHNRALHTFSLSFITIYLSHIVKEYLNLPILSLKNLL